ncbi:MAG TPA: aspartyl-phosphate phosphatase Spo0E family protein [Bacilli bacterium]|nr:aspartyl-phosphate phosphatase Spo0E family protein [Bacilli bacterium]
MQSYLDEIEQCRRKLSEVVTKYQGNLLHPIVLEVSQQLDTYIVNYQNKHTRGGTPRVV